MKKILKRRRLIDIFLDILTLLLILVSLFPLYYMILQSVVDWTTVDKTIIPKNLSLASYDYLFHSTNSGDTMMWLRALGNSLLVCIPVTLVALSVGLLVGYAMTKLKHFNGKRIIFNLLLFEMFFPKIMLLVPKYMILKDLANTYSGMIIPTMISTWAIFMYINYFETLPNEVFEAARVDGANTFRILYHIAMPATLPITTIVFLTTFMQRWNELMWDMLIAPSTRFQTLNVLISTRFNMMAQHPGPLYAASVILTLPIVILFLCFSRNFREGIHFMLK
ncbi:MAG: carbohydrate ABC transporter permease [Faecousia sp.]